MECRVCYLQFITSKNLSIGRIIFVDNVQLLFLLFLLRNNKNYLLKKLFPTENLNEENYVVKIDTDRVLYFLNVQQQLAGYIYEIIVIFYKY